MRKVCSLIFAAIVPGVGFSTASYAAAEPQGGSYVVSGNVTAVTAKGDATCLPQGAAIQGYSYFPGVQGKGKISRSSSHRPARNQVLFFHFHQ
jgi:hypothetical protein